jgi:hypothetical protein
MIVISNTSPLTNLAAIGQFSLLQSLFGQIEIPVAVSGEPHSTDTYIRRCLPAPHPFGGQLLFGPGCLARLGL